VSTMPALFDSSRLAVQPHVCPKCLGPMVLAYIKPSLVGFEVRTFAGTNCDHFDQVVTEKESRKWASSALKVQV
jgi:hypothetical protein